VKVIVLNPLSNRPKRVSKKAVAGRLLLEKIFERDIDKGAVFAEISGIPGSGKTSLMIGMSKRIMKDNPEELIFWRESVGSPCQFTKFGDPSKWQILAEESYPLQVLEITNKLKPAPVSVKYFRDYQELMRMSKPGMLNVVYFKDLYKWIPFIDRLRLLSDWQTVFLDEFEDICPQRCSGITWRMNDKLSNSLKQLRKSRVSIIANTQSSMDADFRVRSKLMFWIYLYGARKDELSPISKSAVRALRVGSGWIDQAHSLFGQFSFPPFVPQSYIYVVQPLEDEYL